MLSPASDWQKLSELILCFSVFMLYIAWKKRISSKLCTFYFVMSNGRLSWNYLPCPPRGGAGRIRGFLATFDCQQCESDTRFVSCFKPNSSLKWRNLKRWRSMSYVLSASELSYTVTIRITVALLNGPMCSWFFSLRWLRHFAINVK